MSQDLLSEFDSFYQPPATSFPKPTSSVQKPFSPSTRGHQHSASTTTFDDLLGLSAFPGEPGYRRPQAKAINHITQKYNQRPVSYHGDSSFGFGSSEPIVRPGSFATFGLAIQKPQSSLLSFEQDDDDDSFGEFATAPISTSSTPSFGHIKSFGGEPELKLDPTLTSTEANEDDDFGDFITSPVITPTSINTEHPREKRLMTLPKSFAASPLPSSKRRPQKIIDEFPPVAILLSKFPSLFLLLETHLLDRLKGLSFALRQRVLSDPKTKEFLQCVCELGRVAGRIIAGRKRRRPLGISGLNGGMKLGTIKSSNFESQKEEREIKEICRLWKEGSGRLRAAMGEAVPSLEDNPRLISTPSPTCKLCKLGPGETLSSLKEMQDKPKWWDSTWGGHGGCKGFWEVHGHEIKT